MVFAKRISCLILMFVIILAVVAGCGSAYVAGVALPEGFESYKDIPGITQAHIDAIENLRRNHDYFIYGMTNNAEAFVAADGNVSGFAAHMTGWLTELFGIPFIPRIYTLPEIFDGLYYGNIHFTGQLTRLPERERIYQMTSPIVSRVLTSVRLKNTEEVYVIAEERTPRLVFFAGTVTPAILYSSNVFDSFEEILVTTEAEAEEMLLSGYADAFVGDLAQALNVSALNYELTSEILRPFVIRTAAFSAQNPTLFPIVEVVQLALDNGALQTLGELYARGSVDFNRHRLNIILTDEERAFIENNPEIHIAARSFVYPVSFYNHHESEFQGVAHDILRQIETLTGMEFIMAHDAPLSRQEIQALVASGESLLTAGVIYQEWEGSEEDDFLRTAGFFTANYALLSCAYFPSIEIGEIMYTRVGVSPNIPYERQFREWFPDYTDLQIFNTIEELFDALENGEIDLVFSSESGFLSALNYYERTGFRVNILFNETYNVGFAVNRDSYTLLSIMNKAIEIIDLNFIESYWRGRTFDYRTRITLYRMELQRQQFILVAVAVACVVSFVFTLYLIMSKDEKKRLSDRVDESTAALEAETAMLNTLFDSIPDVIFCKDLNFRYTRVNKAFEELFGKKREDILGKTEREFTNIPTEATELWNTWDSQVISEKVTSHMEDIIKLGDKEKIFGTAKVPMIIDGEAVGLLGIARDITERKEIESEMLLASMAKTAFIANMSHEIRTPMNSIIGFSELALEEEMSIKARSYLLRTIESSNWLLQIINDVLDISKIESGKLELERTPFNFADIFESCKSLVTAKANEKRVKLHFYAEPCPGSRMLVGDPMRLRQIFINLLTNAIKFTSVGIVRVNSIIKDKTDTTLTIFCDVQDSGIGMTPEQIARATEPFMQADVSITRKYGGTGLGLPIVSRLLEMMGGKLQIESEPGTGSTFSFKLTFDTVETPAVVQNTLPLFRDTGKPKFKGDILVCEDNSMNQMVITDHLARIGFDVFLAENGKIGVEMVQGRMEGTRSNSPFDLILMDIHMPEMDGIDAADKITKMGCETPIVALTANVMATDRESYRQFGMKHCIGKPFTSQELWNCLLEYLTPIEWEHDEHLPGESKLSAEEDERELARKLKESFAKDNKDRFTEISESIRTGQFVLAHRLAHTLKSSAGLIHKPKLQSISAEIEELLRDESPVPEAMLKTLERELLTVLSEITPAAETEAKIKFTTSPARVREILLKLEPLIKTRNPESLDYISEIQTIPEAEEFITQIQAYDFKPALVTLNKLKEVWRVV
ncbi:MAG: ATP-binding protein [Defluviitaleaceae bacterium]|nr:ATP-binding protein [Defluviitaleaceae bacterium]